MAGVMPIILGSGINRVAANITIASDTSNYTLNTAKVTGYSPGMTDVTLTINSGVTVFSTTTGAAAFSVDTSWTTGDTITIINNGVILGRGGQGGTGGQAIWAGSFAYTNPGGGGVTGGAALSVQRAASVNNVNRIAGGGGGGGGGTGYAGPVGEQAAAYAGGGGGGGIGNGQGGNGGSASPVELFNPGGSGNAGTLTSAGTGGSLNGASGGTYGSSGGGSGGGGGAAVQGNANITWIAFGTRNGAINN